MSEELKNSPIEDFDWEAFEKGDTQGEKSREELEKTKRIKIEGAMKKREEIADRAKVKALATKLEKESKNKK